MAMNSWQYAKQIHDTFITSIQRGFLGESDKMIMDFRKFDDSMYQQIVDAEIMGLIEEKYQ